MSAPVARASVADPHHYVADPDPDCHFDADPDPDCNIDVELDPDHACCHFYADPDPTFHIEADLDPDLSFETYEKCSNRLKFHTFCLVIYKLKRIRIQLITFMRILIQLTSL
jgi:hypothetical protein